MDLVVFTRLYVVYDGERLLPIEDPDAAKMKIV